MDDSGVLWIGTFGGGLAAFDGTNWQVYNTSNSDLPDNHVWWLAIDKDGTKWIATRGGGLARYDGMTWKVYNTSNSGIPSNYLWSIAIDENGDKWIATSSAQTGRGGVGVIRFDGTNWTVYNKWNSGLPDNNAPFIKIDSDGHKWITSGRGLAFFDGSNWSVWNPLNSGLASWSTSAWGIGIDENGATWIGTSVGLFVFTGSPQSGTAVITEQSIAREFSLLQNYPNPFNPRTTISYSIPQSGFVELKIYDALGREIQTVVSELQQAGNYSFDFDANNLSNGVYFYQLKVGDSYSETRKMLYLK